MQEYNIPNIKFKINPMAHFQQRIYNCLWFDEAAEEAAKFYTSLFQGATLGHTTYYGKEGHEIHGQPEGKVMTVSFNLCGTDFLGLNGGPQFKLNPSISYFVVCETEQETDHLWNKLSEGGQALMPLDKYDWSPKYGWIQDRYGLSWQISMGKLEDVGQKISPSLMFVNKQHGRAEEAINFYISVFKTNSEIVGILKYAKGEPSPEGTVKHAQFTLLGKVFMAMDSEYKHEFDFNEGISLVVNCDTQEEIDYYWTQLSQDGEEGPCGWLKDKFGLSWQVVPSILDEMLRHPNKAKTESVVKAFMQMKKFDIKKLKEAFNNA